MPALGKKIGPLPAWGWLGVLGGGLLLGLWLRSRAGGSVGPATSLNNPVSSAPASVGADQAPASSGFDPGLANALLEGNSLWQNSFLGLVGATFGFATGETQQWADFAKSVNGNAWDYALTHSGDTTPGPAGLPGPAGPQGPPGVSAPAPAPAPATYESQLAGLTALYNTSVAQGGAAQQIPGGGTIQYVPGEWHPAQAAPVYATPTIDHTSFVGYNIGAVKPVLVPQ